MALKREILETSIPYKTYVDPTADDPNLINSSKNILTTSQQLMERFPGFSDKVESVLTTFTAVKSSYWWAIWGGSRFLSIVCDVSGGFAKVYKCEIGVDTSYVLIFTSSTSVPFDFVTSNNTLYMGNGTDMRKYSGTGSATQKWGIVRPIAIATVGTTGTGISAFVGWYYRDTYCNSTTAHESSAGDLSPCTGIQSNKTITIPLVASTDTQVDQIRLYRTTDGGSTDPTLMQEIVGSPFPNIGWTFTSVALGGGLVMIYTGTSFGGASFTSMIGQSITVAGFVNGGNNGIFTVNSTGTTATTIAVNNGAGIAETHAGTGTLTALDTTTDVLLSIRTAPGTTTNDPPTPSSKIIAYGGRIFSAVNATTYFSGDEELPANGVPEECWPSGLDGNNKSWPGEVTSQRPMADGVAVFTRAKIWKITGTARDNFVFGGLLDRRGAISHNATCALGNSVGWLDTASQVFLDGSEIGFDIRNDIKNIDHSQAYMAIHLQGRFHWLCLLDGAAGKMYVYDLDQGQWMPPKVFSEAGASALSSGESASSTVSLTIALAKIRMYMLNPLFYNDAGSTYQSIAALNLLRLGEPDGKFEGLAVETDSHTASQVQYLLDDDPTITSPTYTDLTATATDPVRRNQGVNLVKKIYQAESYPYAERIAAKFTWPASDSNFVCYTLTINPPLKEGEK